MRDILLLMLVPVMIYAMIQRPFIATGMWLWTALFFPNGWVYGLATVFRYNLVFAGVAAISYLAYKHKLKVQLGAIGMLVLLFFIWTTLSTVLTIGAPAISWEYWNRFFKIAMLFVFVLLTIKDKLHIEFVLWCVVLSVGFYANLEGLKFLLSGGGHKIEGLYGHVLGDRNELALAFVMTLPLCYYLLGEYGKYSKLIRFGLICTMALLVVSVVGTQSRGGFIALVALGSYLYVKSEHKILLGILIACLVLGMAQIVSDDWSSRIDTIGEANDDESFMGRVIAWKISFLIAMENPLFGGGFKAMENYTVWSDMSGKFLSYPWFYTGDRLPDPTIPRAAHSIYFQVLGDHGFGGLIIYVSCIAVAFFKAGQVARRARRSAAASWIAPAATMIQLSIFAFALGGAALSLAYFDLIFALLGLVLVLDLRVLPAAAMRRFANKEQAPTPALVRPTTQLDLQPATEVHSGKYER